MTAVLVTGGSAGIGRAIVARYAGDGASVVSLDVNEPAASDPVGVTTVIGDVSVEDDVRRAVEELARDGAIDVVVCNAGIGCVGAPDEVDAEMLDRVFAVNVRGAYLAIRHALPWLRKSTAPAIAVMSSNAGLTGRGSDPVYASTKWALNGLVRSLAVTLAADGIRINAVCPGPVDTPELFGGREPTPEELDAALRPVPLGKQLGRVARPEEIAAAVAYLCGPDAGYVTGVLLPVDGGKTAGLPE